MAGGPIKLVCVEDNRLVGDAIGRKLALDPDFHWMGQVGTAEELYGKLTPVPPDVVCMDLEMPGQDAFAMIRELARRSPTTRVIILTGHMNSSYVDEAIDAGAWGYISKGEESRFIVDAFRRVARGEFVAGGLTESARARSVKRAEGSEERGGSEPRSFWSGVKSFFGG